MHQMSTQERPRWLKLLTLFAAIPAMIGFSVMVWMGLVFRHPAPAIFLFMVVFVVAAIHAAISFWKLGRTGQ
jgi:uncharacterized membrane protein